MLLADESILRRLPPGLSPSQLVSLDAVRHAADIISLADERLRITLTEIARDVHTTQQQVTSAFSDAWSVIDAVDRIRSMVKLLVKKVDHSLRDDVEAFNNGTQTVRELRNLTDHLYQRVDQVLSSNMPAVGRLSWVTVFSTTSARVCVLEPGSMRTQKKSLSLPDVGGGSVHLPTGVISLSAATYMTRFDDVLKAVARLLKALEQTVESFAVANDVVGVEVGRDLLLCGDISFFVEVLPHATNDPQLRLF